MKFIYLSIQQVKETHIKTVKVSGGGSTGSLELGKLESVLENIQNDLYYPELEDKLTHLVFCANKFHCFEDGNKRIAISVGAQFLIINGYFKIVPRFIQEMENISYQVAASKINKELLFEIIKSILYETDFSEELKLKIYNAINS